MERFLPGLLLVSSAFLANPAFAQDKLPDLPDAKKEASLRAAAPCNSGVERTVTLRKVYLVEEQSPATITKMVPREVVVSREKATTYDIEWKEEKHTCTELVLKSLDTLQEVTCTESKPVQTTDPCTGHTCTVYQQVPIVKKVKITVYETVPVQKEYVVRVPCLKPVEKDVEVKKIVIDTTKEPAICKRYRAETTTCEIKVPICPLPCLQK